MTLYSPLSLRGIAINGDIGLWGLDHITVFISSIDIGFSAKRLRLTLKISNFQIFLTRKTKSLLPVNLIDGFQEPNILFNLLNYIVPDHIVKKEKGHSQSEKEKKKSKSTAQFFYEGIIHLLMMLVMHMV
jgi:hypothetical protein